MFFSAPPNFRFPLPLPRVCVGGVVVVVVVPLNIYWILTVCQALCSVAPVNELTEPLQQPNKAGMIVIPLYKLGNYGLVRGNHWFAVTEPASGEPGLNLSLFDFRALTLNNSAHFCTWHILGPQ